MKNNLFLLIVFSVVSISIIGCDPSILSTDANDSVSKTGTSLVASQDTSHIRDTTHGLYKLPPNLKREGPYYDIYYYRPVNGKVVGYSLGPGTYDMATMKNTWGFSGVFLTSPSQRTDALNAGYITSNMIVPLSVDSWQNTITTCAVGNYYIGEPAEYHCYIGGWNWSNSWGSNLYLFPTIETTIHNIRGSKFIIDGYSRSSDFYNAGLSADIVMFSSYRHWTTYPGTNCWTCQTISNNCTCSDQRDDWTEMKSMFGSKFSATWIGGHSCDGGNCSGAVGDADDEIANLCGHAANLGLSQIWLFCGCGTTSSRISKFCESAHAAGFLRGFYREYYMWWYCPSGRTCNPDSDTGWLFQSKEYTGVVIEQ